MNLKSAVFSKIKPKGFLKYEMERDLDSFIGNLDEIVPKLIKEDDIYFKDRRRKDTENIDVGEEDTGFMTQHMWWNCETQGNWIDGFLRTAILLNDEKMLKKAEKYIENIINSQDSDGYIGIYDKELRFNHDDENGEMWGQATILRALYAYYEYKNDEKIYEIVKKAVDLIMVGYKINGKNPFEVPFDTDDMSCGIGHSVVITDVFEKIYRKTGEITYLEYANWIYDCFSEVKSVDTDVSSRVLLTDRAFQNHGVHTYEQVRPLILSYEFNAEKYEKPLKSYLNKLEKCISPSGAPIGDEFIAGNVADALKTGYEYCSIHELLHSYIKLFEELKDINYLEKAEFMFYNAGRGAKFYNSRLSEKSSIAYLKTDNSYEMTSKTWDEKHQLRYKYSPSHQDAAVCCVPNAGRIYTYFYEHMWYKQENTLFKAFYGASVFETKIDDKAVKIEEISEFPYNNKLLYKISCEEKTNLELKFRVPSFARKIICSEEYSVSDGILTIDKEFSENNTLQIEFLTEIAEKSDLNNEIYYTYGSLLLALEIPFEEEITKTYDIDGFYDIHLTAKNDDYQNYLAANNGEKFIENEQYFVTLYNKSSNKDEIVQLKPMSDYPLRKVTFEINSL